jgi:hypothetical protein
VGFEFKHDLIRIAKYTGRKLADMPYIAGGVSDKRGEELQDMWNKELLPELYVHPASAAHGLNLQDSDAYNIIIFTLFWDYELWDQLIRRLLRQGNKAKMINIYHLIGRVKGRPTVEYRVSNALRKKEADQEELFAAIKDRRQKVVDYDVEANERLFAANMLHIEAKKRAARKRAQGV